MMRPFLRLAPVAAVLSAVVTLGACATTPGNVAAAPSWFDASANQFEGWALIRNGEIHLYGEQRDLDEDRQQDCGDAHREGRHLE